MRILSMFWDITGILILTVLVNLNFLEDVICDFI